MINAKNIFSVYHTLLMSFDTYFINYDALHTIKPLLIIQYTSLKHNITIVCKPGASLQSNGAARIVTFLT